MGTGNPIIDAYQSGQSYQATVSQSTGGNSGGQSSQPSGSSGGSQGSTGGNPILEAFRTGRTYNDVVSSRSKVSASVPIASDRGRGRTSYLRQSMAEGSIPDHIASPAELSYKWAMDNGQDIDSWHRDSEAAYTGAKDNYDRLSAKLSSLKATQQASDQLKQHNALALLFGDRLGVTADNSEEISRYEEALKQAQEQMDKAERELSYASAYKQGQDLDKHMNKRLQQNGYDYGAVYDEAVATVKRLEQEKAAVDQMIRDAQQAKVAASGTGYAGGANRNQAEIDAAQKRIDEYSERYEAITRQLKEATGFRDYASRFLQKSLGAQSAVERGQEEAERMLQQQARAGRQLLEDADNDVETSGGIGLYTRYRGATREGTHVRDDWPEEAKEEYYLRLGRYGQEAAEEYAAQVNYVLNQEHLEEDTSGAYSFGKQETGNKWQKAGAGAAALGLSLTTPIFHAMSYIDKMSAVASGVPYSGRDFALPSDQVTAMVRGRAEQLNKDYGTLGNEWGFLSGKGWGDALQLGQSMVQSIVLGHGAGEAATLAAFFVQAADNAFDEAKARGGSDEYAAAVSTLSGFAEVIGEKVSLDRLLSGGTWSLSRVLKQSMIEGGEEVSTSLLNAFFDRVSADITGNQTEIQFRIDELVAGGMSRQDAEKQVWREKANEIAYEFVGGFVSGFGSGVVEGGVQSAVQKMQDNNKPVRASDNVATEAENRERYSKTVPNQYAEARIGEEVGNVKGMSYTDGKVMVTLEMKDGSTRTMDVDSVRALVPTETGDLLYKTAGLGKDAPAVFAAYSKTQSIEDYTTGMDVAINMLAANGASRESMTKSSLTKALSDAQLDIAYEIGHKKFLTAGQKGGAAAGSGSGGVYFNGNSRGIEGLRAASDQDVRREAQKVWGKAYQDNVRLASVVSKATGLNVVFFDSRQDNGKLGSRQGMYAQDGTVYVDIRAGQDIEGFGEAVIVRTLSHELTHFLEENAPKEYQALRKFVVDHIAKLGDGSFEELVTQKMKQSKASSTRGESGDVLSYQEAVNEVVADACEMMLTRSEMVQQLAYEHFTTAQKMWDHIRRMFRKMRESVAPKSREAVLLKNQYDAMSVMWDAALEQAVKSRKSAQTEASTEADKTKTAPASETVEWQNSEREEYFARDKFFDRQVDQWDKKSDGTRIKVGELKEGSALNRVGFPATGMWFDVGKIRKSFGKHGDHLTRAILKQIPNVLSDPIAITEYRGPDGSIRNTVNVFGLVLPDGKTPVVVGVMMTKAVNGTTIINKIRTIHAHGNAVINDANILYLNEDKKRTRKWFQVCGNSVPLNGTTFGLIRSIAYTEKESKPEMQFSLRNLDGVEENAVRHFGTTDNFAEAGYILPDGQMLKFTDEKHAGERNYDHRAIGLAYSSNVDLNKNHGFSEEGGKYLERFVEEGNIRFEAGEPDLNMDAGIQLSSKVPLTRAQEQTIRDFIAWKQQREESFTAGEYSLYSGPLALHVDFGGDADLAVFAASRDLDTWGVKSLTYEGGQINADRVIQDIRNYYRTGEVRRPSAVAQFHYSIRDTTDSDTREETAERVRSYNQLRADNAALQRQVERLRKELKRTKENTVRSGDAKKLARELLGDLRTDVSADELAQVIERMGNYLVSASTEELDYEVLRDWAGEIAHDIVRTAEEPVETGMEGVAKVLKDYLHGQRLQISADNVHDLGAESLTAWKKNNPGIRVSTTNGIAVDVAYQELQGQLGEGLLPSSVTHPADQLNLISDLLQDSTREETRNPFAGYQGEAIEHFTEDIINMAMGETLRQTAPTFADKAASQLAKAKAEGKQAVRDQREKDRQRLDDMRAKNRQRISDIRQNTQARIDEIRAKERAEKWKKVDSLRRYYQDMAARARSRRKENGLKREYREKIRALKKEAEQMVLRPVKGKFVPPHLMKAVSEMLSVVSSAEERSLEQRQSRLDERLAQMDISEERHEKQSAYVQRAIDKLSRVQDRYMAIANDETYGYAYSEALAGCLEQLKTYLYGTNMYAADMDSDTLAQIYNMMQAVMYSVSEANKAKALETKEGIREFAGRFSHDLDRASAKQGLADKFEQIQMWQMRPDTWFRYICGYAKGNAGIDIQNMFVEGTERKLKMQRTFYNIMREVTESSDAEERKQFNRMVRDPLRNMESWGLKDSDGNEIVTPRGMMLMAYMLLNQEASARSLAIGGFRVPHMTTYYQGNIKASYGKFSELTENHIEEYSEIMRQAWEARESMTEGNKAEVERQIEQLLNQADEILADGTAQLERIRATIEEKLTPYEKKCMDKAAEWWDYSGKRLDEVNISLYNFKPPRPKNYVPIHRDLTSVASVDIREQQNIINLENAGFNKSRVRSVAPILLTDLFMELDANQNRMSNFYGFVKVQRDFNAIYKCKPTGSRMSVEGKIAAKFGTGQQGFLTNGTQYIENYIKSIAGGSHEQHLLSGLYSAAAASSLSGNLRVALGQLASIPTASAELGWGPVIKGFGRGMKTAFSAKARTQLSEDSVWFWQRYRGEGGMRELAEIKGNQGTAATRIWNRIASTKVGKLYLNWCQAFDVFATASMWSMSEEYVKAKGVDITTEDGKRVLQNTYRDVIRRTQPNYTATERSDLLRDSRESIKFLTMFKTQSNQNLNILIEAAGEFNRIKRDYKAGENGVTKADMKAATEKLVNGYTGVILGGSLSYAVLRSLANFVMGALSGYRDDDDELTASSVTSGLMKDFMSSLAGMDALTGILYDIVYSAISGEKYYGISDSAISSLSDLAAATADLGQKIFNGDKDVEWKDISRELKSVCTILGIPYSNTANFVDAARMWYNDIQNGTFGKFEGNLERSPKQDAHRLLRAFWNGDLEKADGLMDALTARQDGKTEWKQRQKAESYMQSRIKGWYVDDGSINEEQAKELLLRYAGTTDREADNLLQQWLGIVESGYDYGEAKKAFIDGDIDEDTLRVYAMTYMGLSSEDADDAVTNLKCERETGYAYKDLMDAFVDGGIGRETAISCRVKYGGYSEEDAAETVLQWTCEKETGVAFSNISNAYYDGVITKDQVKTMFIKYGGNTEEDAQKKADKFEFNKQYPAYKGYTYEQAEKFRAVEGLLTIEQYDAQMKFTSSATADKDKSGKSISGSKKAKIIAYWAANIPFEAALVLYEENGYSKNTISDLYKAYGRK